MEEREYFQRVVNEFLGRAYTPRGARVWWHRVRVSLRGMSPWEVLMDSQFDPKSALAQEVLRLAKELLGPGNAT